MSKLIPVTTPGAPEAIGPYSQAIEVSGGRMAFLSGQIGMEPDTGAIVDGGIEAETRQALTNLDAILIGAGMSRMDVVKTTIYLEDLADFAVVNAIYAEFFGVHRPARATVQAAALPKGARVEIDMIGVS